MEEDILIIQAQQEDAPRLLELQKLAYQSEAELYHDPAIQPLTQTLIEVLKEFESNLILIAIHAGQIVGLSGEDWRRIPVISEN